MAKFTRGWRSVRSPMNVIKLHELGVEATWLHVEGDFSFLELFLILDDWSMLAFK